MLKNYLITYLTSCENLKLIKVGVSNPDLAMLFIPLCVRTCSVCLSRDLKLLNGMSRRTDVHECHKRKVNQKHGPTPCGITLPTRAFYALSPLPLAWFLV